MGKGYSPQRLLRLHDHADAQRESDGEGIQLRLEFELEALHHRDDLARIVKGSPVEVSREKHRNTYSEASGFVR